MSRFAGLCVVGLAALGSWLAGGMPVAADEPAAADPLAFKREAQSLLQEHCYECHGPNQQEMGLNFSLLDDLPSILSRGEMWRKVGEALEAEAMPPDPAATGFTAADRARLLKWIRERVQTIDRSNPIYQDPGPPLVRQFTRIEYNNTMRDLLGVDLSAASLGGIQGEDVSEGFTNLAGSQVMDEVLLQKYFRAAESVLKILFEEDRRKPNRNALLIARPAEGVSASDAARKVLERFVRRAYRRPAEPVEIDQLLVLVEDRLKAGDDYEQAIRQVMMPVLVSPHFLFRMERDRPDASNAAYQISNHELAVRLSYTLWSTMPDEELFRVADTGTLADPEVLAAQLKRMLNDPKATALTEQFAMQWLRVNKLNRALPNRNVFPALTQTLKQAMENETRTFLDTLRTDDGRVLDLLDSDYSYVNEELAKHYGIGGVDGPKMQRVSFKPEDHRGGLLGMSSVLTSTSHSDRTKPTARGKWILDVMLGTPPSPPPANVSNFKPQPKDKPAPKDFREKLAQHASDASCAACHRKIDPLGFALENYDAIGTWRDQVGGLAIDNAGKLPGGQEFHGVDGLKKVLRDRQKLFVRNLVVQLMTYALGRNVAYTDELAVLEICEALERGDFRFSVLVRGVATSRPFLYRKNLAMSVPQPLSASKPQSTSALESGSVKP